MALFVKITYFAHGQGYILSILHQPAAENSRKSLSITFNNCSQVQLPQSIMCLHVIVGHYSCGHQLEPGHGIPEKFIRDCPRARNFLDCGLIHNEEDVPWLCPDCHWAYVQEKLAPLWQQTTITKCCVLREAEIFPADYPYLRSQRALQHLESTFDAQQEAINQTAIAYHDLRDETLRLFLGENFLVCLQDAHHAHRPWTLSSSRDPFARVWANVDTAADSSSFARTVPPTPSPGPSVAVTQPGPGEVLSALDLGASALESPSTAASFADNEDLQCILCDNRGIFEGVTTDLEICFECQLRRLEHTHDWSEPVRSQTFENEESASDVAVNNNAPGMERGQLYTPDISYLAMDRQRLEYMQHSNERIRSQGFGNGETVSDVAVNSTTPPGVERMLYTPDTSCLTTGGPATILAAHRGTLAPLAARAENRIDPAGDPPLNLPSSAAYTEYRIDPTRDPRLNLPFPAAPRENRIDLTTDPRLTSLGLADVRSIERYTTLWLRDRLADAIQARDENRARREIRARRRHRLPTQARRGAVSLSPAAHPTIIDIDMDDHGQGDGTALRDYFARLAADRVPVSQSISDSESDETSPQIQWLDAEEEQEREDTSRFMLD
jgi:hypothetical protein